MGIAPNRLKYEKKLFCNSAKKQNRKLFAIPGPVHSSNSKGPNYLIKNGAILVEDANDILKELNLPLKSMNASVKGENEEEDLVLNILKEAKAGLKRITSP